MVFYQKKKQQIINEFKRFSEFNKSLVFFISSKKINKIIPEIKKYFNERRILICREITKLYEEFLREEVSELKEFTIEPKGELTIVISEKKIEESKSKSLSETDITIIGKMINKLPIKEITNIIYENSKVPKKLVYKYCLKLKNEN